VACYRLAVATVTTPGALARICRELLEDEAAQGVRYTQPMVTPQFYEAGGSGEGPHPAGFGTLEDVWAVMRGAFSEASALTSVAWGVLIGAVRTDSVALAERMARFAADHAGDGVVGFGIAGDEQAVGPEPFARACAIAAEAGLLVVPHAGETVGPASVYGALALGADRLAHGVRSVEDPELLGRLAAEGITCDVCPTSNLRLSVVDELGAHPLPRLLEAGVPVSLGSDDQLFFVNQLADEYAVARDAFGLADSDLADIARTSARASGATVAVVDDLLTGIDAWLAGCPAG
jgi:adenosine deaminase